MKNFLPRKKIEILETKDNSYIVEKDGQLIWKLVRCTICKSIHNRDHNATKNMMKIVKSIISGNGRPKRFKRPKKFKKQK